MKALREAIILLEKDLLVEVRRTYEVIAVMAFPIAGTLTFTVLEQQVSRVSPITFTLIITLLATLFVTTTSFIREHDKTTIYGLKSLPLPPSIVYIAKMLYTFIMVGGVSLATIASIGFFTSYPRVDLLNFTVLVLLFSLNVSSISALASALTMYSEGKFLLLPLIVLVYSFPIVLLSSSAIGKMLVQESAYWEFMVLAIHQVVFTLFSTVLSQYVMEE